MGFYKNTNSGITFENYVKIILLRVLNNISVVKIEPEWIDVQLITNDWLTAFIGDRSLLITIHNTQYIDRGNGEGYWTKTKMCRIDAGDNIRMFATSLTSEDKNSITGTLTFGAYHILKEMYDKR